MRGRALPLMLGSLLVLTACGSLRGGPATGGTSTSSTLTKTPRPGEPSYTPLPSPSGPPPTPLPNYFEVLAVPASIATTAHPVVWFYAYPTEPRALVAMDWDGRVVATLGMHPGDNVQVIASPDGTRILVRGSIAVDRTTVVGQVPATHLSWARDDSHLCVWRPRDGGPLDVNPMSAPVPASLWLSDVGGATRKVLDYGQWGAHGGPSALSCSVPDDRALVAGSFVASVLQPEMVRLSDGRATAAAVQPSQDGGGMTASADGRYVALGDTGGSMGLRGFDVYDALTGEHLVHSDLGALQAFSDDDTRALVEKLPGQNTEDPAQYSVLDWRSGRVLSTVTAIIGDFGTRPGSGDFWIGNPTWVMAADGRSRQAVDSPLILRADGSVVRSSARLLPIYD